MTGIHGPRSSSGSSLLRAAGLLAVAGGLVNAVSDYMLQGGLAPRAAVNTFEYLPQAPFDLVLLGSVLGNAALPFWLLGFWPVYVALAPAGRWLALPPVFLLGYAFSIFPGYHGSYALYAAGFQAADAAVASEALTLMVERMHAFHGAQRALIGATVPIGSLWFAVLVLLGRTRYARWMVLSTPLLAPLLQPYIEMLPAPFGGIVRPAWGTLFFSAFFLLATLVTWNVQPGADPRNEESDS